MLCADLERVDSRHYSVFFLCQKLASLNAALGFGRNGQRGAATSKSRQDTSMCHINFGELSSYLFHAVVTIAPITGS